MLPNLGKAKVKTNIRGWRVEVREIKGATHHSYVYRII